MQEDPDKINTAEYHDTTSTKVVHFLLGFLGNIMIGAIYIGVCALIGNLFPTPSASSFGSDLAMLAMISLTLGALIMAVEFLYIRYLFRTKRYIAIGLLSAFLLPLLFTGFCFFG